MRKERRSTALAAETSSEEKVARTTVFLTDALNFHLDLYALKTRRPKGAILREALKEFLTKEGRFDQVDRIPKTVHLELESERSER